MQASTAFIRIIIRRPQAYEFAARFKGSPIPGVVVLDPSGRVVDSVDLQGARLESKLLRLMTEKVGS